MLPEGITEKVREQEWIPCIPPLVHFPTENRVFVVHGPPAIWGSFFQSVSLGHFQNRLRVPVYKQVRGGRRRRGEGGGGGVAGGVTGGVAGGVSGGGTGGRGK